MPLQGIAQRARRRVRLSPAPRGSRRRWPTVLFVVLLAAVVAVGGVRRFERASHPSPARSADEKSYLSLARNVALHHSYGSFGGKMRDPLHWPPGTPMLFAAAEKLSGSASASRLAPRAVYLTQAALGTLTILGAFAAAALLAGPWSGLVAAAATSFYPPLIEASGHALSEPLGALLVVLSAAALAAAARRPRWPWFALGGALLGLTLLARADLGPVVPFVALWALLLVRRKRGSWRAGLVPAAAVLAGTVVVIAPWCVYASHRAGRLVPISTGGTSALYVGTFLPGDGTVFGLKHVLGNQLRLQDQYLADKPDRDLPQRLVLQLVAARHPGLSQDAALREEAVKNVRRYLSDDPLGFARMLAGKAARMWTTPTRGPFRKLRADRLAVHLVLVILALAGALLGALYGRITRRPVGVGAVLTIVAVSTVINAIYLSEPRHLLPLLPALFAAGAAGWVYGSRLRVVRRSRAARLDAASERQAA